MNIEEFTKMIEDDGWVKGDSKTFTKGLFYMHLYAFFEHLNIVSIRKERHKESLLINTIFVGEIKSSFHYDTLKEMLKID